MPTVIKGADKLIIKLDNLGSMAAVRRGVKAGATHIKGKIAEYPPASEANNPARKRWYERGFGSRYRRADGTVRGYKTSETLGRKWTSAMQRGGLRGVVGNNASYAPFVQASDRQARFHKRPGWKTDKDVIESEGQKVLDFIVREIEKDLNK